MTETLIGRGEELAVMHQSLSALSQRPEGVSNLPIVEYTGPPGIGKTAMHVGGLAIACAEYDIPYVDGTGPLLHDPGAIEDRLSVSPLAISVEVDHLEEDQRRFALASLWQLFGGEYGTRLFASITSRDFQRPPTTTLSRRIAVVPLGPLDKAASSELLSQYLPHATPESRAKLIQWVGGYPYALVQMARAVGASGLDPEGSAGYEPFRATVGEVIDDKTLMVPGISDEERERRRTILTLMTVPRRSNVALIREMIKRFAPQYALTTDLSYVVVPLFLNKPSPDLFDWDIVADGFRVHEAVAPMLRTDLREGDPKLWDQVHRFLVRWNWQATHIEGRQPSDKRRSGAEAIYHTSVVRGVIK